MAVLTIRNLPDEVRDRLRRQAAAAGTSMEARARAILAEASLQQAKTETPASLQKWVDGLYKGRKPSSVVDDLLATRRSEARAERGSRSRTSRSAGKRK